MSSNINGGILLYLIMFLTILSFKIIIIKFRVAFKYIKILEPIYYRCDKQ